MTESLFIHLFCGVFIVTGGIILGFGILLCRRASATRSWPSTEGIVRRSEIVKTLVGRRKLHSIFEAVIAYEYSVDGQSHSGSRVNFLNARLSLRWARRAQAQYPVGSVVKVYYDPDSPGDAILRRGIDGSTLSIPLLGLFFMTFAVGFWWFYRSAQ